MAGHLDLFHVGVYLSTLGPLAREWCGVRSRYGCRINLRMACWLARVATKIKIHAGAKHTCVATNYENDRLTHYLLAKTNRVQIVSHSLLLVP
jgi:hypothetical protein